MPRKIHEVNMDGYVEIKPFNWSEATIERIAKKRLLNKNHIRAMLSYNVITFRQLANVTGVSESRIRNASVKVQRKDGSISSLFTICNPFPDMDYGKLFILVDEKCREYIMRSIAD